MWTNKCGISVVYSLVLCFCDLVWCYNVDVNFPIVYKGPDDAHFGYSIAIRDSVQTRDNWIQVGAPKGQNVRFPFVESPGAAYMCPYKQVCRPLDVDSKGNVEGEIKTGGWLGGSMDVNSDKSTYAVCGHRYINDRWKGVYYMIGSCFWGRNRESILPRKLTPLESRDHNTFTLSTNPATKKSIVVYDWGNGLAGASVHIPRTHSAEDLQLVLGAPGVFNLRGAAILYRDSDYTTQPIVTNPYTSAAVSRDDDYVGYQVSSGYFYNPRQLLYVTSAPRASMYRGKVIVFEFPNRTREAMVVRQELVGETFSEYFGASLASGDLDGDHLDDLVVGAPQWSAQEDEGRVYVYSGSNQGKLLQSAIFSGASKGALFGYAVQILGDLDHDGFNDLVVGAPYENAGRGALYIYYGGSSGLSEAHSTRIAASQLSPRLMGFGVSFSRAEDMDRNGYGDFAVGSFISGHAVLLRTRPVADIVVSLKSNSNSLDHSATKFTTHLCVIYMGHAVPATLNLLRSVSADKAYGRVTLTGNGQSENVAEVQVTKDSMSCETLEFDLKAKNYFESIEITASFSLKNITNESIALMYGEQLAPGYDGFCPSCPVLRRGTRPRASLTISFASHCEAGADCTSDLRVSSKLNGTTNGAYVLGSGASVSLEIDVTNKGEAAYRTELIVLIPKPVDLESIPSPCQEDKDKHNNIVLICSVANPLIKNKTNHLTLPLDMSKVGVSDQSDSLSANLDTLSLNVTATTTSKNTEGDKNTEILKMKLRREFDITVTGKTPQDTLSYDGPDNETAVESLRFQHTFIVQKFGASPIHEALLTVLFPYSMADPRGVTSTFLQVYSIQGNQDGQPLQCTNNQISYQVDSEYSTDELDYESYESSNETFSDMNPSSKIRRKRQATSESANDPGTLKLDCESHRISCYIVKCSVGPFIREQSVARLVIEMAANVSTLKELLGDRDLALFSSSAEVMLVRPEGAEQSPVGGVALRPDNFVLSTLFIGSPRSGTIAIWIIALSVVVGLLLLSLLIAGLVKAGFFKRTAKEELEALKEAEQVPFEEQGEEQALNNENTSKEEST